jgi:hypothetical protein
MNRFKKEEAKQRKKRYENLTDEEIQAIEQEELAAEKFGERVRFWHARIFSDEYDFMYDDHIDAQRRSNGENPMRQEYIDRMNKMRRDLGLPQFELDGSTYQVTYNWVATQLRDSGEESLKLLS